MLHVNTGGGGKITVRRKKWVEIGVTKLLEVPHASFKARNYLIHEETVDTQKKQE